MIRKFYLSAFLVTAISLITSCGGTSPTNENANKSTNINSNSNTTAKKEEPTTNNAPTLGPVVQQYNEALRTKNDQMLRDTLTADFAKSLEKDMKDAKRKDFAAFVAESDYRPGQVLEVRNEKIEGNKGVAEIRGGAYKNWTPFSFALENGKWRFTGGSPDIENMPPSNTNAAR